MQLKHVLTLHIQGTGLMNEDQLLVGERIFGVFDGATSLNKYQDEEGNTGGFLAARTAKEVFGRNNKSLVDLAKEANEVILDYMKVAGVDISDKGNLWSTSAAVIRIEGNEFEWMKISDCVIITIDKDNNYKLIGGLEDHDIETLKLWKECAKQGIVNIREKLADVLLENRRNANINYGVLNGELEAAGFMLSGKETLENIVHVILMTDGMFIPTEHVEDDDWETLVKLYLDGGLERISNEVHERQEEDPNMCKYPRFKPSDDMSAIALQF